MRRGGDDTGAAAEAVARNSYGKLVAFLAARTGDVAAAEDALADAFAAALRDWPAAGVPVQPEAWLMAVAQRRLIDAARHRRRVDSSADHLRLLAAELEAGSAEAGLPDHRLALMFACAHPAIDTAMHAPLMLQTILGFDAATIASAFLVAPATMGQRLVRAKGKIREAGIPFRIPDTGELRDRLETVLAAIYAVFAEGWCDPLGTETRRRNLAEEGIWLGRLVAALLPDEAEALGLLALMLYAEARRAARRDANGEYVPLAAQDPALWDAALIDEAETALRRASTFGGDRPLPARSGGAIGACRAPADRMRALGGDRAALRCARGDDGLTGCRGQPRGRDRRDARRRGRAGRARRTGGRQAAARISALLGGARRAARPRRRSGRRHRLSAGDRS